MCGVVRGGGAGDAGGGRGRRGRLNPVVGFFGPVDQTPQRLEVLREPLCLQRRERCERGRLPGAADGPGQGKGLGDSRVASLLKMQARLGPRSRPCGQDLRVEPAVKAGLCGLLQCARQSCKRRGDSRVRGRVVAAAECVQRGFPDGG